jgi:type II secretory pathway predicted ATPase ExeA
MESQRFLTFWGLKSLPGNGQIDLDNLYWQDRTQTLCSRLLLSLQKTASISVIVAPPGHGKSTLARWLYHRVDQDTHDAALFSLMRHEDTSGWLLPKIAQYLGLPPAQRDSETILRSLRTAHGKILTVIIDNAHYLQQPQAFDEIVSLCQVQSLVAACPLNFVLIGNPRLGHSIQAAGGMQHRLGLFSELLPFSRGELQNYLAQRLQDIGISRRALVPESVALIAQQGPSTFAGVNALLEACLFEAFLKEQKTISTELVHAAMDNSGFRLTQSESPRERERGRDRDRERERDPDRDEDLAKSTKPRKRSNAKRSGPSASSDLNSLFYNSGLEPDGED